MQTEQTLAGLEVVEAETGVPVGIARHCQAVVNAAALGGNLLLIGEPGAGKSAVINALGRACGRKAMTSSSWRWTASQSVLGRPLPHP